MQLVPEQEEVLALLRRTGALRQGHFEYPCGMHASEYAEVPLAMRCFQHAKMLSVGLSRLLRGSPEIRAGLHELSVVAPATAGLPVAHGVCEALEARQVYWAEPSGPAQALRFPQYIQPQPGEKVVLVDDILRTGTVLTQLRRAIESYGAEVVALAVIVYQPMAATADFGALPLYYLAKLNMEYRDPVLCPQCRRAEPLTPIWHARVSVTGYVTTKL